MERLIIGEKQQKDESASQICSETSLQEYLLSFPPQSMVVYGFVLVVSQNPLPDCNYLTRSSHQPLCLFTGSFTTQNSTAIYKKGI
jgi:hypothetical protein